MSQSAAVKTNDLDTQSLEDQVKATYKSVALAPHDDYHFEMGRGLTEKLGYPTVFLDHIPPEAIDSFAGVGYFFHHSNLQQGQKVVDLGSGSGTDSFIASHLVGPKGHVVGIDMTNEQRFKSELLSERDGFKNISFVDAYIEDLPVDDNSIDAVISNGVINLSADKASVFAEIALILNPGGRLVISDIVTEVPLPGNITCNADLWAACIGGAEQEQNYQQLIEGAGLTVTVVEDNDAYGFISGNAQEATKKWGVKSVTILAVKHG